VYRKILVPVTADEPASSPLDQAAGLAEQLKAELVMLGLVTVIPADEYFFKQIQLEEGSSAHKAKAIIEAHLAEAEAALSDRGIALRSELMISEEPDAEAIVNYAEESGCDLIVVPNRAHTGIGRWLFSSLGDKVRRRSAVPVLFV
jgi:nucleotide-binding universal stress UspA family protein